MRVVWSYIDWSGVGLSDLHKYPYQLDMVYYSVQSWIQNAPEFERVLYVDNSIKTLLEQNNLLGYFNKVFMLKLEDIKACGHFFALPKLYVYGKQTEPFWICDLDMVLLKPLNQVCKSWDRYYCFQNYNYFDELSKNSAIYSTSSEDWETYYSCVSDITKLLGGTEEDWSAKNSVNGGLIFFPRPKETFKIATTVLKVNRMLSNRKDVHERVSWNLYEESIIRNIIRNWFKTDTEVLPFETAVEHTVNELPVPDIVKSNIRDAR